MATTSDIRKGLCIRFNHDIWKIIEFQHVKPGKGAAFVRTKIKSLTNGKVLDNTFPAGHKIDDLRVENRTYQYLYNDDQGFHFMNTSDYNQIFLAKEMMDAPELMKEGIDVQILFDAENENPLTCEMPSSIELEVTYTEPGVKGDTATNAMKPATVETGAEIQVPLFINEGDKVKVSAPDGKYMERVK
ncbi:elongation factor P [Cryomorphaceae bacterium]|nr:elongation factor P [Cryomorphaceae bacterium]